MPSIKLQSSDGEIFPVDMEVACKSITIKAMLEDLGMYLNYNPLLKINVPIQNVNAVTLKKIIEWLTYHKDDPISPNATEDGEANLFQAKAKLIEMSNWDQEFLQVDIDTLSNLIYAASFLDIKGLLDVCCKRISKILRDSDEY